MRSEGDTATSEASSKTVSGRRLAGVWVLGVLYVVTFAAGFVAPYDYRAQTRSEALLPRARLRLFDEHGDLTRPFVYAYKLENVLQREYAEDKNRQYEIELLTPVDEYKLAGLIPVRRRLFGVKKEQANQPSSADVTRSTAASQTSHQALNAPSNNAPSNTQHSLNEARICLLGTDALGRDRFSRLIYAGQFSLIVAPLGTLAACVLGVSLGLCAAFGGTVVDKLVRRLSEVMIALPSLVLALALRAALPLELAAWQAGGLLIVIFACLGWAEFALLARNLATSLREREFVLAARSLGLSETRIAVRHILPNMQGALAAHALVVLPTMLLAETALSFFGAGVQEPVASYGSLLAAASDVGLLERQTVEVLAPAIMIMLFVGGVKLLRRGA